MAYMIEHRTLSKPINLFSKMFAWYLSELAIIFLIINDLIHKKSHTHSLASITSLLNTIDVIVFNLYSSIHVYACMRRHFVAASICFLVCFLISTLVQFLCSYHQFKSSICIVVLYTSTLWHLKQLTKPFID